MQKWRINENRVRRHVERNHYVMLRQHFSQTEVYRDEYTYGFGR